MLQSRSACSYTIVLKNLGWMEIYSITYYVKELLEESKILVSVLKVEGGNRS